MTTLKNTYRDFFQQSAFRVSMKKLVIVLRAIGIPVVVSLTYIFVPIIALLVGGAVLGIPGLIAVAVLVIVPWYVLVYPFVKWIHAVSDRVWPEMWND